MADIDKRMTLKEAVSKFIHDGDVVYYGGFQIHVPMALTHEIIRQKKRHLTTIESSTDVGGLDLMVGAGCVSEIHTAWIMNWYVKAPYAIRRAFNKGHLKRYGISNFGATTAMMAGFMGIPFMSIRATAPTALAITVDDPAAFVGGDATFGMLATMAALQRGEVDVAFIGGAQIDKFGNINSTGAGDWSKKESFTYFAGSGGANDMATSGKRVLAIMPQDKKKFVEKCEYITTPGFLGGPGEREALGMIGGGPDCVVSTMGVYRFDENTKEMYLTEFFPGQSVEKISAACAWDLKVSPNVVETTIPTEEELKVLRSLDPTGFYLG